MPYITREKKQELQRRGPENVGELTYAIDNLIDWYLRDGYNYAKLAEVIAALDCAKEEFRRRIVNPYEDAKLVENGEVFVRALEAP